MVVVEVEVVNVVLEHPLVERLLSRRRLVADFVISDGLYSANEQVHQPDYRRSENTLRIKADFFLDKLSPFSKQV